MQEHYADLLPQADVDWGGVTVPLENAETPQVTLDEGVSTTARGVKQFIRDVHTRRLEAIRVGLCQGQQQRKAAWLASQAFKGSGAWLMGNAGMLQPPNAFADEEEYVVALRMRLLVSPFSAGDMGEHNRDVTCQFCQQIVPQGSDYLHLVDCQQVRGYKNQRHKRLAGILEYHLKKIMGPLGSVSREPCVVGTKRADIEFNDGTTKLILDVGICSPCSTLALQAGSDNEAGVAARLYATAKDTRYRQLLAEAVQQGQNTAPNVSTGWDASSTTPQAPTGVNTTEGARGGRPVWPLIWEATGRPGKDVKTFVDSWFIRGHASRSNLVLTLCQTLIVRYTARSVIAWARMLDERAARQSQNGAGSATAGQTELVH